MLVIAGGILIAVAALAFLPVMIRVAYWTAALGVTLGAAVIAWLLLSSYIGQAWASGAFLEPLVGLAGWSSLPVQERTASGVIRGALMFASAIAVVGLAIAVFAIVATLAVAVALSIIGLFVWVLGPIGMIPGVVAFFGVFVAVQRWWKRARSARGVTVSITG